MNTNLNKTELKKAIVKIKAAAEDLVKYVNTAKKLTDEQLTAAASETFERKLSAFEDSLKNLEDKGLVSGKVFGDTIAPLTRFPDLGLVALKAGNTVEQNDLKSFEYAILKTMDKLDELLY